MQDCGGRCGGRSRLGVVPRASFPRATGGGASQDTCIALCPWNTPATPGGAAQHVTPLRGQVAGGGCPAAGHFTMRAASATPSRDTFLQPSWDMTPCAAHTICTLSPQVPTTGGGLPRQSVRSHTCGLHCCIAELSWNACSTRDVTKICGRRLEDTSKLPKYCDIRRCTNQQNSIVIKSKK